MNNNISYYLHEFGWSTLWIYVDGDIHEISISHSPTDDPIFECIDALMGLIAGDDVRSFYWYGEPGGMHIVLRNIDRRKQMIHFTADAMDEETIPFKNGIRNTDDTTAISFEISLIQLVRMFYYEFKKVSELLKDPDFATNRALTFPSLKFKDFEDCTLSFLFQN